MKKSPLSRSIVVPPGASEDATNEWNEGVAVKVGSAAALVADEIGQQERIRTLSPGVALAALLHPSAPTAATTDSAVRKSPRHRGAAAPPFSLAKTLATKALANAHRRGALIDTNTMPGDGDDPSYVVVNQDHRPYSKPYAETVTDGVVSPERDAMPAAPISATMQDGTHQWAQSPSNGQHQTPMRMPEPSLPLSQKSPAKQPPALMAMPEPTIPSTVQQNAPISMPEPQAIVRESQDWPYSIKMPEPQIENLPSAPISMPLPAVPQIGSMSMPKTSMAVLSPNRDPPPAMPVPHLSSTAAYLDQTTTYANSQPAPSKGGGALVPDSTYDPASLQPPQWTDTRTPATAFAEVEEDVLLGRMKLALQHLPPSIRASLPKEELIRVVLEAIKGDQKKEQAAREQLSVQQAHMHDPAMMWTPYPYIYEYAYPSGVIAPEAYDVPVQQVWPAAEYPHMLQETTPPTANEWYQIYGGGLLPAGWTAHFDHGAEQWYYSNMSVSPPITTWHDPRLPLPAPVPVSVSAPPPLPPSTFPYPAPLHPSRQDADYLASQFGALEAHRQYRQNAPGPVTTELSLERSQSKEIQETLKATQKAQQEANEAIAHGRPDDFQAAQEAMVKARGKLDRIKYEAQLKNLAMVIPQHYQGPTRGFDFDPAFLRPRIIYTDSRVIFPPPPPTQQPPLSMHYPQPVDSISSFSGRVMGKFFKQRLPNNLYTPTAYPLPPGVKYKASTTTPTPYSIPEFCFAWDVLLRSRRAPNIPAPYPY